MSHVTFTAPDLTTFCRLDGLGLVATGQRLEARGAVIRCDPVGSPQDRFCDRCGAEGKVRDTVTRVLAHEPFGWRPTTLWVRVRRYRCQDCRHVWRQDTSKAAQPRARLSRSALRWALTALVVNFMSMRRIAKTLGVSWHTANEAVLAEGHRVLISDPTRFEGVKVIGVDEHKWSHQWKHGHERFVTVIIDLTGVREGTGSARLLDMVPGQSRAVFAKWLQDRPRPWREGIEIVAMDGFAGFKTATTTELPDAQAVMDPFHVVKLAGEALNETRRRVQQQIAGRRGRKEDRLYRARNTLQRGADLLTDKQAARLEELFDDDQYVEVEAAWGIYQRIRQAYRQDKRDLGKWLMRRVITDIATGVPEQLVEIIKLATTLTKRRGDVLAYFDHPGTSNGPTEAINGRLEHLRGIGLGFRNLTNYIARSLLHAGGFRQALHP